MKYLFWILFMLVVVLLFVTGYFYYLGYNSVARFLGMV